MKSIQCFRPALGFVFCACLLFLFAPALRADTVLYPVPDSSDPVFVQTDDGVKIVLDDFGYVEDAGNPLLPAKSLLLAVPGNAIESTISISLIGAQEEILSGTYDVASVGPAAAFINGQVVYSWGDGKNIVNGRNQNVYGADAYYVSQHAMITEIGALRDKKVVRVRYCPYLYNPVQQRLVKKSGGEIVLSFSVDGSASLGGSDPLMEPLWEDLIDNYEESQDWGDGGVAGGGGAGNTPPGYSIVTRSILVPFLGVFIAHKESLGYNVIVTTESEWGSELEPQDLFGDPAAEAIRRYLIAHYPEDQDNIRYVLLVGNPSPADGNVPMKMLYPKGPLSADPDAAERAEKEAPSDYYYADLDSNWDSNGNGFAGEDENEELGPDTPDIDRIPEVLVGRIPVYVGVPTVDDAVALAELEAVLNKMIAYENGDFPGGSAWTRNVFVTTKDFDLIAGDNTETYLLGNHIVSDIRMNAPDFLTKRLRAPLSDVEQQAEVAAGLQAIPEHDAVALVGANTESTVVGEWQNNHPGLHIWWGHGSFMSAYGIVSASNVNSQALSNDYPSFIFGASPGCATPGIPQNLAARLLVNGAVATIGATGVSWHRTGQRDFSNNTDAGLAARYHEKLIESYLTNGQALYALKADLGSASPDDWMNLFVYNLYGDPSMYYALARPEVTVDISTPEEGETIVLPEAALTFTTNQDGQVKIFQDGVAVFDEFLASDEHTYTMAGLIDGDHEVLIELRAALSTARETRNFVVAIEDVFLRGEVNDDGEVNLTDAIYILNFLFLGGPEPIGVFEAANTDDNDSVNLTDGVYLLNFLFLGGPPPPAPYPRPGVDGTPPALQR